MTPFRAIAFDLDDTLLDTWGQLVPKAARESCEAMIAAGLNADVKSCLQSRREFIQRTPRGNVYTHLVGHFGVKPEADAKTVAQAGSIAFHHRTVEKNLSLLEGARDLLESLKNKGYRLFLVTAGAYSTQQQKVRNLGIASFFEEIHYVDPARGENKHEAFKKIMATVGARPEEFLSVGNRVDADLAGAKMLGWQTCWVKYGEYAHLAPSDPLEKPDFIIEHIKDLGATCRL